MGEVRATLLAGNTLDETVPGLEIDALVDAGAVMSMLPEDVVDKLAIPVIDKAVVTLANEKSEEMDVAGPITITIGDRKMFGSCLVGPVKSEPLIGQLVLESLDLIVDCARNALRPRPESPAYPSYKLK
uniref:Clan AA aspartic protease, AF_0612 family n=1 Tax=Candidatus Kentrum sp. DK TaxID=2126562 RepID=A0A450S7Q4_9GAMM|nr:MAG: clan AA aspartic protease, AF_0612 family [Candidatus Kentron sp. DK]VFJ56825.1 MAG: clan AA aspartic protease, AF_0612 family [Candidatus Kentron sp. DK]